MRVRKLLELKMTPVSFRQKRRLRGGLWQAVAGGTVQDRAANSAEKSAADIAARLTGARRAARTLEGFPGPIPATLYEAYAIQSAGIDLWRDEIVGWKVGGVAPKFVPVY